MLSTHLERGTLAGAVGGVVYGLFVWLVGTPLIRLAETYEHHGGHDPAVPASVASATSVLGGVLFGVVVGVTLFGLVHYFFEPALPTDPGARSLLLGAAGFFTVSGAPWVALPPQPPGVEAALSSTTRLGIYAGMMVLGALTCILAWRAYTAYGDGRWLRTATLGIVAVTVVPVAGYLTPAAVAHTPVPATLTTAFRWTTVFGQGALWLVLGGTHAWLLGRTDDEPEHDALVDDALASAD
jgi:predicted cobalt transporter CbtA